MGYEKLNLDGKVAIVIGGTSGIGAAVALGLAEAGADVVASSRGKQNVNEMAARIAATGRRTLAVPSDVTDLRSLETLHDAVTEQLGPVNILINAAGRTVRAPSLELGIDQFETIIDTNLTGVLRTCQVFGRGMLERGQGRIVNIASLASFVGFLEVVAYTASKAGVVGLTRSLAVEWGPKGVNVNAIAPGVFVTDLNRELLEGSARGQELLARTPLARFGRVDECVGAAIFLVSEASSFVNGEVLTVDGGFLASGVNQ